MTPDRSTIKRHLLSWGSGTPAGLERALTAGGAAATVLVESSEHVAQLRSSGVIGPRTVVFAPDEGHGVTAYEGSASEPGQELVLGDFYLQIQDYATSPYMTILGPTLVRLFGGEDLAALLEDADAAREQGTFPEFATAPAVQLADLTGLGLNPAADGPELRLFVDAAGCISTSTTGVALGSAGATPDELAARWRELNDACKHPDTVCLGAAIDDDERVAALKSRPWLGRYLLALDALRDLHARGATGVRVSGFGGRLDERIAERPEPDDEDGPLLLWTGEASYVRAPQGGRTFELTTEAGRLAELLLVCGSIAEAGDMASTSELEQVASMFDRQGVALVREAR